MGRPTNKKGVGENKRTKRNYGKPDLISTLPDGILSSIISSLSIKEAARSSILSKRWRPIWKNASCLDFDITQMIKRYRAQATEKSAEKYSELVHTILHQHIGNLISCRFKHFPLIDGEMEGWIEYLNERKNNLDSLSLACVNLLSLGRNIQDLDQKPNLKAKIFPMLLSSLELSNYELENSILSAFKGSENLKILKLKNMVMSNETINGILEKCSSLEKFTLTKSTGFDILKFQNSSLKFLELRLLEVIGINVYAEDLQVVVIDSLICSAKDLQIYSQNLKSFSTSYDPIEKRSLKTHEILENCSDLFESRTTNIFQKLMTLSIELNLNNMREVLALSYILRPCICLNTLEVNIPIFEDCATFEDCALPFPKSMFWERKQMYNCINHNLKFVTVSGFTGKEQEVKFLKHLVTKAYVMENLNIGCASRFYFDETVDLLLLPRASPNLIIKVEENRGNNKGRIVEVFEI